MLLKHNACSLIISSNLRNKFKQKLDKARKVQEYPSLFFVAYKRYWMYVASQTGTCHDLNRSQINISRIKMGWYLNRELNHESFSDFLMQVDRGLHLSWPNVPRSTQTVHKSTLPKQRVIFILKGKKVFILKLLIFHSSHIFVFWFWVFWSL